MLHPDWMGKLEESGRDLFEPCDAGSNGRSVWTCPTLMIAKVLKINTLRMSVSKQEIASTCAPQPALCSSPFAFTMASAATSAPADSATGLQSATKKARSAYEVRNVLVIVRARPREREREA